MASISVGTNVVIAVGLLLVVEPQFDEQIEKTDGSTQDSFLYYGGFTLEGLAAVAILFEALSSAPKFLVAVLEFPLLVWIGRISYGLYLWNFPILWRTP